MQFSTAVMSHTERQSRAARAQETLSSGRDFESMQMLGVTENDTSKQLPQPRSKNHRRPLLKNQRKEVLVSYEIENDVHRAWNIEPNENIRSEVKKSQT